MLEDYAGLERVNTIVRRGCRVDQYVATYKFKWSTPCKPGIVIRWPDPGNWLAILVKSSNGKALLKQRKDDATETTLATSSALSLTSGNWYTAKVVIDDGGSD